MDWETLSWGLVALSLLGNVFIIKKNVTGQWLWLISNIGWISYNMHHSHQGQAFLFLVYTALCVWGIITWTRQAKKADSATA